jgi:hypothetical protein
MQTLLYRGYNILNVIYHALVGFNMSFVLALLLAQWTWLELRVNTGMMILLGCLSGAGYGLMRDVRRPLIIGSFSVLALLCTSLIIAKGDFEAMRILIGVMFREGMLMPDLSLLGADLLTMGLGLLTILVSLVHYRAYCATSQTSRKEKE